jgi:hypothetical protein
MKYYGIRNKKTKKPLGFCYNSNDGNDFCEGVSFEFDGFEYDSDNVWLVKNKKSAERVFKVQTPWYNSRYETPEVSNYYFSILKKECEIFEIEI